MTYRTKEFAPGRWHVVNRSGSPVYDDARDGNDAPLVFTDPDVAEQCADNLNREEFAEQTDAGNQDCDDIGLSQ